MNVQCLWIQYVLSLEKLLISIIALCVADRIVVLVLNVRILVFGWGKLSLSWLDLEQNPNFFCLPPEQGNWIEHFIYYI